jgi:pimeloyl-ACP methyl ester carboxylesterase
MRRGYFSVKERENMGFPFFWRAFTPKIRDRSGHIIPRSIASLEWINLGGVRQTVLIRGANSSCPLLLFLHGGPGMPAMYLAHKFQRSLEQDFVVVQWDRRGAGKSYNKTIDPDSISVEQEISDTIELVNVLRSRFGKNKIYLLGHSYGSYLGMITVQRFPELFHAYVGVGQLACSEERTKDIQDRWIRTKAEQSGNRKALEQLNGKGSLDREKWLFQFGAEIHKEKSRLSILSIGLRAPEYNLTDLLHVRSGVNFTHKYMKYNAISGDLMDAVQEVKIPVYFFTGRFDYTDPFECTEEYACRLQAPRKEVVWFNESAHFPFLEEPVKFAEEMRKVAHESKCTQD